MPGFWSLVAVFCAAGNAPLPLLIAPPIFGQGLESARGPANKAIKQQLDRAKLSRIRSDAATREELRGCKNKMRCIAQVALDRGAPYVIHTIVGRQGAEVVAQVTLISAERGDAIKSVRVPSGPGKARIGKAVGEGIHQLVTTLLDLPEFSRSSEPIATKPATPEDVALAPEQPEPPTDSAPRAPAGSIPASDADILAPWDDLSLDKSPGVPK